jgi:hypothetical protein
MIQSERKIEHQDSDNLSLIREPGNKAYLEWVVLENTLGYVGWEKLANVIPAVTKCHLREVICPK